MIKDKMLSYKKKQHSKGGVGGENAKNDKNLGLLNTWKCYASIYTLSRIGNKGMKQMMRINKKRA